VGVSGAAFAGVRTVVSRRSGRLGNQVLHDVDARLLSTRRSRDRAELGHRIGDWWPADIAASHLTFRSTAPTA
jgi:hypothetical protein